MIKSEVKILAEQLLNKTYLGIHLPKLGWKFGGFSKATSYMGLCSFKKRHITISEKFLEFVDYSQVKNTILHEIAHALDFEDRGTSDHGQQWKRIARVIGCDPSFHVNINKLARKAGDAVYMKYKYSITCDEHGFLGGMMRKPKRKYICQTCRKPVNIKQNY